MEDDGLPEEDGMADSGYLESQANNMDPNTVGKKSCYPCAFSAVVVSNYAPLS